MEGYSLTTVNSTPEPLPPWYIPSDNLQILRGYYCLLTITGSFGNIITIIAILRFKDLRSQANYYVLSLALADLGLCTITVPVAAVTLTYEISGILCKLVSLVTFLFLLMSVISLGTIAFNRYILICRSFELYRKIFTTKNVIFSIIGQWISLLFICSLPLFGFGSYGYNPFFGVCIFTLDSPYSVYFLAMTDIIIIYPSLILTLGFYIAVLRKFIQSQRSVHASISNNISSTITANHDEDKHMTSGSTESTATGHGQKVKPVFFFFIFFCFSRMRCTGIILFAVNAQWIGLFLISCLGCSCFSF